MGNEEMVLAISIMLFLGGLVCLIKDHEIRERAPGAILALIFGGWLMAMSSGALIYKDVHASLVKGVSPEQTRTREENHFKAEILIIYKDGKLDSVALVPNTTAKVRE